MELFFILKYTEFERDILFSKPLYLNHTQYGLNKYTHTYNWMSSWVPMLPTNHPFPVKNQICRSSTCVYRCHTGVLVHIESGGFNDDTVALTNVVFVYFLNPENQDTLGCP